MPRPVRAHHREELKTADRQKTRGSDSDEARVKRGIVMQVLRDGRGRWTRAELERAMPGALPEEVEVAVEDLAAEGVLSIDDDGVIRASLCALRLGALGMGVDLMPGPTQAPLWVRALDSSAVRVAIGRRIRELRVERGISQELFALRTGIHATAVRRLERGDREPRATMILRLAHGLEVPPGALLEELEGISD
jgi:DNA-binding XRE family transcriptional regulator